jgi:hypothetical protein
MPPAADAVRLVDGHQLQAPRRAQLLQGVGKAAGRRRSQGTSRHACMWF